jgi:hypothetical protein
MLEEEERLQQLLKAQKLQLQSDLQGIKHELKPFTNLAGTVKKFLTRKSGQAITSFSIRLLVDGLVKNLVLARAGWLTRMAVPFFLKNYASHFANEPGSFMDKLKHMFGRNGKVRQE